MNPIIYRSTPGDAMPDGTLYRSLLHQQLLGGAGLVEVPHGHQTWPHNHQETEVFVITQGCARLEWDSGNELLCTGDAVVIPPLMPHSLASADADMALKFAHAYWLDSANADAAAAIQARTRAQVPDSIVVFVCGDEPAAASAHAQAAMVARWCTQRSGAAHIITPNAAADDPAPLLLQLTRAGHLTWTGNSYLLPLQRLKTHLLHVIDRVELDGTIQALAARHLQGELPEIAIAPQAALAQMLAAHHRYLPALATASVLLCAQEDATDYALGLTVLLSLLSVPLPVAVHCAVPPSVDLEAQVRREFLRMQALVTDVSLRHSGCVPEAGRWGTAQLMARDEIRVLAGIAGQSLNPLSFSMPRHVCLASQLCNSILTLGERMPPVFGCESFDADERTVANLQLAGALHWARVMYPTWPEQARALAGTLGQDTLTWDTAVNDAERSFQLLAPGTRLRPNPGIHLA